MEWLFIISILAVAFFYSSVGHGGASGYLALMALYGVSGEFMKPMALSMNIVVSLVAFIHYTRAGYFSLKLFLPFALTSVPAAFFGSWITPDLHICR